MARKSDTLGGGVFIMIGLFAGIFIGRSYGQISLGAVIGLGAGALVALAVWLLGRDR